MLGVVLAILDIVIVIVVVVVVVVAVLVLIFVSSLTGLPHYRK
jgi:hypothetical protein